MLARPSSREVGAVRGLTVHDAYEGRRLAFLPRMLKKKRALILVDKPVLDVCVQQTVQR